MGSLTKCNHCTVNALASRAARQGKFLKLVKSNYALGGHEVHICGHREVPCQDTWCAWVMNLPTRCCCG